MQYTASMSFLHRSFHSNTRFGYLMLPIYSWPPCVKGQLSISLLVFSWSSIREVSRHELRKRTKLHRSSEEWLTVRAPSVLRARTLAGVFSWHLQEHIMANTRLGFEGRELVLKHYRKCEKVAEERQLPLSDRLSKYMNRKVKYRSFVSRREID